MKSKARVNKIKALGDHAEEENVGPITSYLSRKDKAIYALVIVVWLSCLEKTTMDMFYSALIYFAKELKNESLYESLSNARIYERLIVWPLWSLLQAMGMMFLFSSMATQAMNLQKSQGVKVNVDDSGNPISTKIVHETQLLNELLYRRTTNAKFTIKQTNSTSIHSGSQKKLPKGLF